MKRFVCPICGYVHEGNEPPAFCPQCKCPGAKFKVEEAKDLKWACEHTIGIPADTDAQVVEGLKANFTGECTEVGMYLAMSRQAGLYYTNVMRSGVYFGILLNHWSYTLDATCAIITGGTLMPQIYSGFSSPKS